MELYKKKKIYNRGGSFGYKVCRGKEIIINEVPGWVAEVMAKTLNKEVYGTNRQDTILSK